jgi:hypothetical protein
MTARDDGGTKDNITGVMPADDELGPPKRDRIAAAAGEEFS